MVYFSHDLDRMLMYGKEVKLKTRDKSPAPHIPNQRPKDMHISTMPTTESLLFHIP